MSSTISLMSATLECSVCIFLEEGAVSDCNWHLGLSIAVKCRYSPSENVKNDAEYSLYIMFVVKLYIEIKPLPIDGELKQFIFPISLKQLT